MSVVSRRVSDSTAVTRVTLVTMSSIRSVPRENLSARLRQVRRATRAQRLGTEGSARELILVAFGAVSYTHLTLPTNREV